MLLPIAYHQKVRDYFKKQKKTWEYFAVAQNKEEQLQQFKSELLKNTYKFDETTDTFVYDKVKTALKKLDMDNLSVTVYQAQYTDELNASIVYLHHEAHIVFSGAITKLLNEEELLAVLAHELTHVKLYNMLDGDLEVADRIITSIANNYASEASYFETARLFRLYTEIFCDRGAYHVSGDIAPIITSLIKTSTGLENVNVANYLKQADEILSKEEFFKTHASSHPENFIRAKAMQIWHLNPENAEKEIEKIMEGLVDLDQLDLFKQDELSKLSKKVMQLLLKPKWFRSTMVLSQAKQFFPAFAIDEDLVLTEELIDTFRNAHLSVKNYFCYVLLDFALVDPGLEEIPFGWTYQFAEDLQLKEAYDEVVKKELKFSDKKLTQHKKKTLSAYYEVKENDAEQIYNG